MAPRAPLPKLETAAAVCHCQNVLRSNRAVCPNCLSQAFISLANSQAHLASMCPINHASRQNVFAVIACTLLLGRTLLCCEAMTLSAMEMSESSTASAANATDQKVSSSAATELESLRIVEHECFTKKSLEDCESYQTDQFECQWCERWCIHQSSQARVACNHMNESIFPKFNQVLPTKIFQGVPTLIMIIGTNLHNNNKTLVGVDLVTQSQDTSKSGEKYTPCTLVSIPSTPDTEIWCIIEGDLLESVGQTIYPRLTYDFTINESKLANENYEQKDLSIKIIPEGEDNYSKEDDDDPKWYETNFNLIAGVLALLALVICLTTLLYVKRRRARALVEVVERLLLMQRVKKTLRKKGLYAEYSQVQLKTKLGDGNFGEVYQAQVSLPDKSTLEVAIKKLKKGSELAKIKLFLTEGIRMSSFKHERILSPVAMFIDESNQMPSIVLPIMANGDLCRYLRKNKVFPIVKLLTFALQIAEGMEYLSSIGVVHGDLAARNCLLDENLAIKIGDFGLSRQMYRTDYVTINDIYRPIRWMALECLASKKPRFTLKSDLWAYGVVLWETFTLGSYPYEEFDNWDLAKHLQEGYRLHKPLNCPSMVYALMARCWSVQPAERPSFGELRSQLTTTLNAITKEANGPSDLAHSSVRDHFSYTSLAERFVQSRRISSQSTMSSRSDASSCTQHSVSHHWA